MGLSKTKREVQHMKGLKLKDLLKGITLTYKTNIVIVKKYNDMPTVVNEFEIFSYDIRKIKKNEDCLAIAGVIEKDGKCMLEIRIIEEN